MTTLKYQFDHQRFANDYALIDGVLMHGENPENFLIPPDVVKRHVSPGQFLELRIDSSRFSVHEDAAEECFCPSCNGAMTKPILRHEHPETLVPLPEQSVPSRGWGEDFWVRVSRREQEHFLGVVDNRLIESRLHELRQGDEIAFHQNHILAVHAIHRPEIVAAMNADELKELARWLGESSG